MKISALGMMLAAALVAGGCTTTFQVKELDPQTKRFATQSKLPPEAIKVQEGFDIDNSSRLLFVRTNFEGSDEISGYFEESIEKYGYFGQVMRKDEFERFLITNKLQDQVGDVSGFASLSKAAGLMGDFVFADIDVVPKVGYQVQTKFTVYDARTAKELFRIDYEITNWAGLDGPLFQPVMNAFFDWIEKNSKRGGAQMPSAPAAAPAADTPSK